MKSAGWLGSDVSRNPLHLERTIFIGVESVAIVGRYHDRLGMASVHFLHEGIGIIEAGEFLHLGVAGFVTVEDANNLDWIGLLEDGDGVRRRGNSGWIGVQTAHGDAGDDDGDDGGDRGDWAYPNADLRERRLFRFNAGGHGAEGEELGFSGIGIVAFMNGETEGAFGLELGDEVRKIEILRDLTFEVGAFGLTEFAIQIFIQLLSQHDQASLSFLSFGSRRRPEVAGPWETREGVPGFLALSSAMIPSNRALARWSQVLTWASEASSISAMSL